MPSSTEHKNRIITAIVGVLTLAIAYYFLRGAAVLIFSVGVSIIAYWEFLSITGERKNSVITRLVIAAPFAYFFCVRPDSNIIGLILYFLIASFQTLLRVHSSPAEELRRQFQRLLSHFFGFFYLVFFPSFIYLVHERLEPLALVQLLGIIWLGDTAAYYGGKLLGRHKLSPNISPGKTLEGSLVAFVACAIFGITLRETLGLNLSALGAFLLMVSCSAVAQAGDLLESLIKRAYGVKDSGFLLPGHGGVFDRFDSLILAAPFFYWVHGILTQYFHQ